MKLSISSLSMVLAVATCALASPIQLQGGVSAFQDEYPPATAAEYLSRYLEDRSNAGSRHLDGNGLLLRQTRRGLDSLSGATFGQSKRFAPPRRPVLMNEIDQAVLDQFTKKNIDEIDHTGFDNFFKRNIDEIDQGGWGGFVKRLDNYLANQRKRR